MEISVAFEDSRNDALLRKVMAAAKYSYGFRDEIRQLSRDFGTGTVIDAIVRVCSEGGPPSVGMSTLSRNGFTTTSQLIALMT